MQFLGALLLVFGLGLFGYCVRGALVKSRPGDLLFACLAPMMAVVVVIGIVLLFVPDFFSRPI